MSLLGLVNTIVTGLTINPGTYTFNSASDYFGLKTVGGTTAFGCLTGQTCNTTADPEDIVTINVAQNGVVTLSSSSLEVVALVPENDPRSPIAPLVLLVGAAMLIGERRQKIVTAS